MTHRHHPPKKPSTSQVLLQVMGLHKSFGDNNVLNGIDLTVDCGSVTTVLGPSGAGKSVFLKCVAGVMDADGGNIIFDGEPLNFHNTAATARFRNRCSFLFQGNALFDSFTALENVSLPLEQTTTLSDAAIRTRSMEALEQLELHNHWNKHPASLSGGMQKRLALARAIVTKPELVFFDEPTAGLDPLRRNAVFTMIAKYQRKFGFTALVVTHDVAEALVASNHVALLNHGRICFDGCSDDFLVSDHAVVRAFRDSPDALRCSLEEIRKSD